MVEDSDSVTLDSGETVSGTLEWETQVGEAGNYTITVSSDDDSKSTSIDVVTSNYSVTITSTNSPVTEGDSLDVNVDVTNSGQVDDTQDALNLII